MRPKQPKIHFTFKDFEPASKEDMLPDSGLSKTKTAAFAMLFGTSSWRKVQKQLSAYLPGELPYSTEEIRNMSHEKYAEAREEILRSQQRPDKDEVVAEVRAPDLRTLGIEGQKMFIENFGHSRFFEAMEMNPRLDEAALAEASGRDWQPYETVVGESKQSVRARERERQDSRKKEIFDEMSVEDD